MLRPGRRGSETPRSQRSRPFPNLWERLVAKSLTFTRFHLGHADFSSRLRRQSIDASRGRDHGREPRRSRLNRHSPSARQAQCCNAWLPARSRAAHPRREPELSQRQWLLSAPRTSLRERDISRPWLRFCARPQRPAFGLRGAPKDPRRRLQRLQTRRAGPRPRRCPTQDEVRGASPSDAPPGQLRGFFGPRLSGAAFQDADGSSWQGARRAHFVRAPRRPENSENETKCFANETSGFATGVASH